MLVLVRPKNFTSPVTEPTTLSMVFLPNITGVRSRNDNYLNVEAQNHEVSQLDLIDSASRLTHAYYYEIRLTIQYYLNFYSRM